ncbi:hypothetical protein [Roseiconus lacunae]|uniref:DUF4384 domain-containing protein n=1 Tax=Roseiconus lacunae TaxID=2605694 RepID=A0ABT7PI33_9BACT|nr:hypothetical protein [Roseiconus lacunae]MCD0461316.1 hypothetical protein [Roseiconus lacunae]MDM4016143.1 hypothetical protein [Roseiconus lacunae]WRQ51523.1 hypothetical protein U8335_03060 [Stieleria sp. HD01]
MEWIETMEDTRHRKTMRPWMRDLRSSVVFACVSIICSASSSQAQSKFDDTFVPQSITKIPAGISVTSPSEQSPFNRLVLLANPRLSAGDAKTVSDTVRDAATKSSLTIMASVTKTSPDELSGEGNPPLSPQGEFRLASVGVGYSISSDQGRIIVSADTASELGVSLGLIQKQVLRSSESQLQRVTVVGKTDQIYVFDAPSIMHRRDQNRRYLTRHFVYLDAKTGEGAMMVWLMAPLGREHGKTAYPIIDHPIRVLPFETVETRDIFVDAGEFNFLGVPSEAAFGLVDLPPGRDIRWSKEAAMLAGSFSYSHTELNKLSIHLAALLKNSPDPLPRSQP